MVLGQGLNTFQGQIGRIMDETTIFRGGRLFGPDLNNI
jgi:hypothetical protein